MKSRVILLFFSMIFCQSGVAALSSSGTWNNLNLNFTGNSRFIINLQLENRVNFNLKRINEFVTMPSVAYMLTRHTDIWIGYQRFSLYNSTIDSQTFLEQVLHHTVTTKKINFILRGRLEQRYLSKDSAVNHRVRGAFFLTIAPTHASKVSLLLTNEVFLNLNNPRWTTTKTFGQNRAFAGFDAKISKHANFIFGYLNRLDRGRRRNSVQHLVFVSLIVSPGEAPSRDSLFALDL